jgi:Fe-S cluster assembly iron-binding protein IscA
MLNITDSAVQKCKEFLRHENLPDHGIRIFAITGG